jgi:hypothetical protein
VEDSLPKKHETILTKMVKQYGKNEKEQNRKRRETKRGESYSKDFGTYYNVSFK